MAKKNRRPIPGLRILGGDTEEEMVVSSPVEQPLEQPQPRPVATPTAVPVVSPVVKPVVVDPQPKVAPKPKVVTVAPVEKPKEATLPSAKSYDDYTPTDWAVLCKSRLCKTPLEETRVTPSEVRNILQSFTVQVLHMKWCTGGAAVAAVSHYFKSRQA